MSFGQHSCYHDSGREVISMWCRETGMMTELSSVPVHSLVPEPLQSIASADEFMARLPEFDGLMAQQLDEATAAGDCLRFVGGCHLTVPCMQLEDCEKRSHLDSLKGAVYLFCTDLAIYKSICSALYL